MIVTVPLGGALDGHTIDVNTNALTMGMIEDLQGGTAGLMLDAVASAVAGGTLPGEIGRAHV